MPDREAPRLCRVAGRDTWHIYHSRRRWTTGSADRSQAEAVLARYIADEKQPAADVTLTISDLLARYLADRKDAEVPGAERLEYAHKPLARFFGAKPPEVITAAECRRYVRERAKAGAGSSTARTELQALTAALRWAQKPPRRWLAELPEMELPGRPPPRDRWLTRDEADKLVAACRGRHVRLFVLLALHTSARKGAILGLSWDRVDLERGVIDFRSPEEVRTNKRRVPVPVNATLRAALEAAKTEAETEWVIEWAGGPVLSVKRGFGEACTRAGLEDVTPHTLRHTAATWMAQKGVSLWDIAGMMGHTNIRMLQDTYGHHSPEYLREAADALG